MQILRKECDEEEGVRGDNERSQSSADCGVVPTELPVVLIGNFGVGCPNVEINQGIMYSTLEKKNGLQDFTSFSNLSSVDSDGHCTRDLCSSDSSSDEDSELDDQYLPQKLEIPTCSFSPPPSRPSMEKCKSTFERKGRGCMGGLPRACSGKNQIPKCPKVGRQEEKVIDIRSRQRTTQGMSLIPRASRIPSPRLQKPRGLPSGRRKSTRTPSQLPAAPIS